MRNHRIASLVLALSLCTAAHASSKLKLVKDGKTVQYPNAYATRFVPNEGPARLFLLFTDVKAPGLIVADAFGETAFGISHWIEGTTAHALELSAAQPPVGDELCEHPLGGANPLVRLVRLVEDELSRCQLGAHYSRTTSVSPRKISRSTPRSTSFSPKRWG